MCAEIDDSCTNQAIATVCYGRLVSDRIRTVVDGVFSQSEKNKLSMEGWDELDCMARKICYEYSTDERTEFSMWMFPISIVSVKSFFVSIFMGLKMS